MRRPKRKLRNVQEKTCTRLRSVQFGDMNMTSIQKQHINWLRSKFAVGSTDRMTKINASLRIAAHYSRKK